MYRLTDSFPYLVNRVGSRVGEVFSQRLAEHELTLPMYRVMAALRERENQRLSDLAEETSVEISTLSRMVSTMTARKLVSRDRAADNARTVQINLTDGGRLLLDRLIPLAIQHEAVALRGFDLEAVARLKRDLCKIFENLVFFEAEILDEKFKNKTE